jgi:uncharacterized protein involved in exopolysaccharide biosynthesis
MDLGSMLRVIVRRWYASVPGLVMAIVLPAAAWFAVPAKYQSTSTISLLNSSAASSDGQRTGNAFSAFDNTLTPASDYLARTLSSDQAGQDLAERGVTDVASAVLAPNAAGPFLTLTVTGKQPGKVVGELKTFDQYAIDKLASIQREAAPSLPPSALLRAVVVVPPQQPTASKKTRMQDVAGAMVAGLAVLFLASFGAEALALKRAGKRTAEADAKTPAHQRGDLRTRASKGRNTPRNTAARRPAAAPVSDPRDLRRYLDTDRDLGDEDEPDPESWIVIEPLPLEDLAVGDREPNSRRGAAL